MSTTLLSDRGALSVNGMPESGIASTGSGVSTGTMLSPGDVSIDGVVSRCVSAWTPASPPVKEVLLPIQLPPFDRFPRDASQDKEHPNGDPDGLMGTYLINHCPKSRNGEGHPSDVIDVAEFNFLR